MKDDLRKAREIQIEHAAYALLAEKGYGSTSMLSIAKRAKCSNETLYNWYGDKIGLMEALIRRNATEVREVLETALTANAPALQTLERFAPLLLSVLLGDRAVELNRAAAADISGGLGKVLANSGRGTIQPLVTGVMEQAIQQKVIANTPPEQAAETFLGLLIGDLQIRRVTGAIGPLDDNDRQARSKNAITTFLQLYK